MDWDAININKTIIVYSVWEREREGERKSESFNRLKTMKLKLIPQLKNLFFSYH